MSAAEQYALLAPAHQTARSHTSQGHSIDNYHLEIKKRNAENRTNDLWMWRTVTRSFPDCTTNKRIWICEGGGTRCLSERKWCPTDSHNIEPMYFFYLPFNACKQERAEGQQFCSSEQQWNNRKYSGRQHANSSVLQNWPNTPLGWFKIYTLRLQEPG